MAPRAEPPAAPARKRRRKARGQRRTAPRGQTTELGDLSQRVAAFVADCPEDHPLHSELEHRLQRARRALHPDLDDERLQHQVVHWIHACAARVARRKSTLNSEARLLFRALTRGIVLPPQSRRPGLALETLVTAIKSCGKGAESLTASQRVLRELGLQRPVPRGAPRKVKTDVVADGANGCVLAALRPVRNKAPF